MKHRARLLSFCVGAVCAARVMNAQTTVYKDDNTSPLNAAASWVGGSVPTASDIAAWDSRVSAGSATVDIGGVVTWDGLLFTDPAEDVTINGTDKLTLDGGATIDIDMSAATRDLTINTTVALDGSCAAAINADHALTINGTTWAGGLTKSGAGRLVFAGATGFGNSVLAAGDTFWTSTATASGTTKLTGGSLTLRGNTLLSSGSAEALAVYNGTLVLDGGAFSMTNSASRVFVGRTDTTSDGVMIVSNGTHRIDGTDRGSMANFIGVSNAKRGRLYVENGSLTVNYLRLATNNKGGQVSGSPDEIVVNGGILRAEGTSVGFMMCTYFDESMVGGSDREGRLTMNGGRFEIPDGVTRIAPDTVGGTHAGSAEILLNGGVWAVKQLTFGNDLNVARSVTFDGGTLEGTNVTGGAELVLNAPAFKVRAGGACLSAAAGTDCSVTANFEEDPSSPGGALVKTGPGRLTLHGTHTVSSPLIVSNGLLCLTGALIAQTNLVVAPGGGLSLADGNLSTFAPTSLRMGSALVASSLELEVASAGSDCDALALPDGAWFQRVAVSLVQQGTTTPVARTGDFPIMTYAGTVPSAGNLNWGHPVLGFTCTFSVDTGTHTVYAHVAPDTAAGESVWIHDGSGAWPDSANWGVMPGNTAGTRVLFGGIPASPVTVTLDTAATVGQVTFSNDNAYALSGSGSLVLDNGLSATALTVVQGSHTVALPLAPASDLSLSTPSGSTLTLAGAVSGDAALFKQGAGTAVLTADNSYAGGTTIQNGILDLEAGASAGTGPINIAASGARLRATGSDPVTITNTVNIAANGGMIDALVPMTLTGPLHWNATSYEVHKAGVSELIYKGATVQTGACRIRHRTGTFRVADGGRLELNSSVRDTIYMADGTSSARTFTVETGAVVVAGGLYTGSGPSNTVYVNGGSLTLTGSGNNGESGLIRTVTDVVGTDRIIIDAGTLTFSEDDWLSLGVRGGGAEIIVSGGTATFGRLSLGVRADTGYGSTGVSTYGNVWVNGGVMDVAGAFNWMGDVTSGRVNRVTLNGGTLRLPATIRSVSDTIANSSALTLNGGTLQVNGLGNLGSTRFDNYLSGLNDLFVDQGGAVIDTYGYDVTITQTMQRVDLTTGGLTKRGAGTLTLTGDCGIVGVTTVEKGTLHLQAAVATTGLCVSNGATLNLRNGTLDALSLDTAELSSGARLDVDVASDSASCDRIGLPSGASFGTVTIGLYVAGGDAFVTRPDVYPIFSYTGTPPDVGGLTLAPEAFGVACTFVTNTVNQTIDAVIVYDAAQSEWQNSGAGNWSEAGNWRPQAPAASGAVTRFGDALTADATVTVDGAVSVAGMIFDHVYRYTLNGAAVTLDNGADEASVAVWVGSHTLATPLTLSGTTVASIASGAELTVPGQIGGAGSLSVQGGGVLALDGTNATPLSVSGGSTVAAPAVDAFGGALILNGGALTVAQGGALAQTVSLGADGGTFSAGAGQTLAFSAAVTGDGGLTKAGGGILELGANAAYTGATASEGGTLHVTALPSGPLLLGRGTFAFTGTGATAQPVAIDSGTNAAVLNVDGDLTFNGAVTARSGGLFKRGTGTLRITGATENRIAVDQIGSADQVALPGVDGDGPSVGAAGLSVAAGTLVLGAAGQTNRITGEVYVGLNTTTDAGAETAGELVIAGGYTEAANFLCIGRNNGSVLTAPLGLTSRVIVQDGTFVVSNVSLSANTSLGALYTGRPELTVNGGDLHVIDSFYAGNAPGAVATITVNGGTLRHEGSGQSLRLGQGGGEGILRVTGGTVDLNDLIVGYGGSGNTGTVELAGGELIAKRLYSFNTASYSRVLFNGGVFKPVNGAFDTSFDVTQIGDGPAIFDTSLWAGSSDFSLSATLTGAAATDGGLIKAGAGTMRIDAAQTYTGPTVVSNGVLRISLSGSLPADSALTIAPGARFMLNSASAATATVSGLTLGDASDSTPAEIEIGVDSNNATNDQIVVNGDVTAHHAAFSLFWPNSQVDNIVGNGLYELLRWTGSGPAAVDAFSVANPQPGKQYVFSVAGQSLWLNVRAATSGANYVWSAAGGGNWSDGGNWVAAPDAGAAGAAVRFDEAIAADASVQMDESATVGSLFFNSASAYTLARVAPFALTFDNGGEAAVMQVEQGRHVVGAPLILPGDLDVKPISGTTVTLAGAVSGTGGLVKLNGGELVLGAVNSFTGGVRLLSGSVTLTNGATTGTGPVGFERDSVPLSVKGTATSVLAGDLAVRTSQATVDIDESATLRSEGSLSYETGSAATLVKQGGGDLVMAGRASNASDDALVSVEEGGLRFASGADYRIGNVGRAVVHMDANNGAARTLAVESGAQVTMSGLYLANGTNTIVVDGQLDFTGNDEAVCLRTSTSIATVVDRLTVGAAGNVTVPQATWVNVGIRGPGELSVEGGSAQLGSVSLGYTQNRSDQYGGAFGRVFVTDGGLLDVTGRWNWMGDSNNVKRANMLLVGNGGEAGATVRLPPTTMTQSAGWSSLGLDKGTLATPGGGLASPVAGDYLYGLKQIYVSTNGGTFDTAGQDVTFSQTVCSDGAGGTLAKAGTGSLTLSQPLAWGGLVDVRAGILSAALSAADVRGPAPANLLARYSFENGRTADTSGNGRHGASWGDSAITSVTDPAGGTGVNFPSGTIMIVPMDAEMRGMDTYTLAMWVNVASVSGGGTSSTFFTTRMNNGTDAYQIMVRILDGKLHFMASSPSGNWPGDYRFSSTLSVPAGEWFHAAAAVTASSLKLYVNGQPAGSWTKTGIKFCPPTRAIGDLGFGIGHPYLRTNPTGEFTGQMDDVQIYSRALSDAEIAALASDPAPSAVDLRVAGGSVFDAQSPVEVRNLSGEGFVAGGVTVCGSVSPGDSTNAVAGTVLTADDLTFGTNTVYKWTWSPTANDELHVQNLTVDGTGVVDLGRAVGNLINGSFSAVLMRYETVSGADHFTSWTLANAGGRGYTAVIHASDGEVVLEFTSNRGTVMWLK